MGESCSLERRIAGQATVAKGSGENEASLGRKEKKEGRPGAQDSIAEEVIRAR